MIPGATSALFYSPRFEFMKKPSLRQWLLGHLSLAGLFVLGRLPYKIATALGRGLGLASFYLARRRRHITQVNISLCWPELSAQAQQQLVKQSFLEAGQGLAETALAWFRPIEFWRPRVRLINGHLLDQALAEGGVLLLCGHFGSLDAYGAMLANYYRYDLVQRDLGNPVVNRHMQRARQRYGQSLGRKQTKDMIRSLRNGQILWYAPDQDFGRKQSVFADFFGQRTATLTATTRLAQLGKAKVVPGHVFRDAQGYCMEVYPPLAIPSASPEQDAQLYNQWLEACIRRHPSQYLWQHRRFKTRPSDDLSNPYRR